MSFKPGAVIPASRDRKENLYTVLDALEDQTYPLKEKVVICDGWQDDDVDSWVEQFDDLTVITIDKYEPSSGMDQPRNVGAKNLERSNYVWFLDSDCLPAPYTLEEYEKAWKKWPDIHRIMLGPYDWMEEGIKKIQPELHNDPRWAMFHENDSDVVKTNDLGMGLGCFSGNLVWPLEQFKQIGGFWNELHMGRCEDGELGIRAASLGVPMSCVRNARAWHMGHGIDFERIENQNERDVPLIHERHGKLEETGLKVVNEDGKRLNYICEDCNEEFNTLLYWEHKCQTPS